MDQSAQTLGDATTAIRCKFIKAAENLGLHRSNLYRRMWRLGMTWRSRVVFYSTAPAPVSSLKYGVTIWADIKDHLSKHKMAQSANTPSSPESNIRNNRGPLQIE